MRCLAVCQTELVVRMLETALASSFETEFLVESRPLARKLHEAGIRRHRGRPRPHRHLPQGRPHPHHLRHRRGQRPARAEEAPGGHQRRRRHADLRAGHGHAARARAARTSCAPRSRASSYLTLAELFGGPLVTQISRSLTRARVQQYQRYFADADRVLILLHNDPDPDAMASGLALRNILRRTKATAILGTLQGVTRPENLRMANLLDIQVESITPASLGEFERIAMVDVQPHYFGELLHTRGPRHRPPPAAARLQRRLQGHPVRLRFDVHDPHRAPARGGREHLGAHRHRPALRDQVRHAVLQPPGQPRGPRGVLVPLPAGRRHA